MESCCLIDDEIDEIVLFNIRWNLLFNNWIFILLWLKHSQGMIVSAMYCFLNGEVREVLRKRWRQYWVRKMGVNRSGGTRLVGRGSSYYNHRKSTFSTIVLPVTFTFNRNNSRTNNGAGTGSPCPSPCQTNAYSKQTSPYHNTNSEINYRSNYCELQVTDPQSLITKPRTIPNLETTDIDPNAHLFLNPSHIRSSSCKTMSKRNNISPHCSQSNLQTQRYTETVKFFNEYDTARKTSPKFQLQLSDRCPADILNERCCVETVCSNENCKATPCNLNSCIFSESYSSSCPSPKQKKKLTCENKSAVRSLQIPPLSKNTIASSRSLTDLSTNSKVHNFNGYGTRDPISRSMRTSSL